MEFDVVIVGGSFAGLSAAMQLVRGRRRVLVVDAAKPRNRFAHASHGFLGQDGRPPAMIRQTGIDQLQRYPGFELRQDEVLSAEPLDKGFSVALASGDRVTGARLILAGGVKDSLPEVAGLTERWGQSVAHCPYCHGFEMGGGPLGILLTNKVGLHQALLLPDWGPTTLFLTEGMDLDDAERARLVNRGVAVETTAVVELVGEESALSAARLADGRLTPIVGLFVQPKTSLFGTLAGDLGLELEDGPTGAFIRVDQMAQTSRPGVFAAGDAASVMHNATLASGSGVRAASGAHFSLIHAEAEGEPRLCARA
ncbi:NAD(P)/FAD-dependent oxidoreductase [Rhizobium sp. RU36D]|uniref:NAD(P)/FAD-dependent oxidoreductase n=1 Tax=Rhizobium sp. RU36D TaxID=1907415 RepID=UPI0009D7F6B0|nr:NAD(P)/FAD-dependent oxidoreductase [Rhizobium sp. RU36D]SMD14033.1 Thioredoxin reductase [Rhizobium sp. RU36D]